MSMIENQIKIDCKYNIYFYIIEYYDRPRPK